MTEAMADTIIEHFPPLDKTRAPIALPIKSVTLLEDRASVRRRAMVGLVQGTNRFIVENVAPVLQDVSLVGSAGGARVVDVRVRRALRVTLPHQVERVRALEEEARRLGREFSEAAEARTVAMTERRRVLSMVSQGAHEIPTDASWGLGHREAWSETFESLFEKARGFRETDRAGYFRQRAIEERVQQIAVDRAALERPDSRFAAWLELDVLATQAGAVEVVIEYIVPNALWRPLHEARLVGDKLSFGTSAAIWQNTGEDWTDAELSFSTALSSLGVEPPRLSDDLLNAQKRSERVAVEARQVAIEKAGVGGGGPGAPPPSGVDLPGVDDGGEVRVLKAEGPATVVSDGRPVVLPLVRFEAPAERALVVYPELDPTVFEKVTAVNRAKGPILAGPVALFKEHGPVGWTKTLFIAPDERFELSFGPDDDVRLRRTTSEDSEVTRHDKFTHLTQTVEHFVSNLSAEEKVVSVTERVPVSELAEVRIAVDEKKTSGNVKPDKHGFLEWRLNLPPHGHGRIALVWTLSKAPGVEGI
ncbi:MAG: mucoidy inhibitor MuiA family protein [Myxococcota bacterium]